MQSRFSDRRIDAARWIADASSCLTIINNGATPDRLLGGSSDAAAKVGVHEMASNGGVTTMRAVDGGLALAPGATVTSAPGGYHT